MFAGAFAARLVALWGFWILVLGAYRQGELSLKTIGIFVGLWVVGFLGLPYVLYGGLFLPYVALLDIAFVLVIFKGDVRIL